MPEQDQGASAAPTGLAGLRPEPASGLGHSAAIPSAAGGFTIPQLADALANFPENGKPPMDDLHFQLVICGFIIEHEITKPRSTPHDR